MTAASNSEGRKRRVVAADPVEIVARAEYDRTGPWFDHLGHPMSWDGLTVRNREAYAARMAHASTIVAALQAAGLLTPP